MDPTPQMYAELVPSSGFRGLYWMNLGAQSCFGPIFLGSISSAIPHSIIFCSRLKPFQGPGFCFIIYQVSDCKQTLFICIPLCLSCQDPVVFCPIRGGTVCIRMTPRSFNRKYSNCLRLQKARNDITEGKKMI